MTVGTTATAKTILVVDDMPVIRDPIAASLRAAGYTTLAASTGQEALRALRAGGVDLVVMDVVMPEMDGLAVLRQMRAESKLAGLPVILLTSAEGRREVLEAAKYGARDYLLKSRFSLKELLARVARHLAPTPAAAAPAQAPAPGGTPAGAAVAPAPAASGPTGRAGAPVAAAAAAAPAINVAALGGPVGPAPRLLTRDECVSRAEGIFQAKTLSGVVMQVIALANSPRGDATQLASLIARDPMLSARVLQAANSAAHASAGGVVTTIPDAIRKVGSAAVRNVAAALGVFEVMPESSADGFNPIHCWQHSFAVAQLCEQLVRERDPDQAGVAYVVGLCHDLSEMFLHTELRAEFQQVMDAVARTGRPREQLEREMLGMTHAEMVRVIFNCLGVPDGIRQPVEILHGPRPDRTTDPIAAALWMAENYANGAMLASTPRSLLGPLSPSVCKAATGLAHPPGPEAGGLRSEVLCLTAMLARLSRDDEAKLLRPAFERRPVRLWLARDPALSTFDPVEVALGLLAELSEQPRLPLGPELHELQGLVVVTGAGESPGFSPPQIEHVVAERAKAGRPLPLLWLSGNAARAAAGARSHKPVQAPVSLADIAAFVADVAAGSTAGAVAA